MQRRFVVGLRWQTDSYDSKHHWICKTHTWIHAIEPRWPGKVKRFLTLKPGLKTENIQILLLKTGSFELAIIRMSRLMDLSQNAVLYGEVMLPQEAFYTSNSLETKLVAGIFETAKTIAELKLTETELALYQSLVLLWPGEIKENGTYSRRTFLLWFWHYFWWNRN